jgi:hypothetical protein
MFSKCCLDKITGQSFFEGDYFSSDFALLQISSNMAVVNLPVCVFCWLGW